MGGGPGGSHQRWRSMNPPLVSVVIAVHNGRRYLEETLRSVRAQTHPAVELIVVDDGSSDGSRELVRTVAPQAELIAQANQGVSTARNRGLAASRGDYVAFLDQDDVWHPQHVEAQLRAFEQEPERGAVVCPFVFWRPGADGRHDAAETLWPAQLLEDANTPDPAFDGWLYHQFLWDCWALTSATLLRRDAVVAAGGFDETLPYSEDWDLWLRLSRAHRFVLLPGPPVLYRQHAVQGSRSVRTHDFRIELLERAAAQHGLASRDGRAMAPEVFTERLAQFQAEFAYQHLQIGSRRVGVASMLQAWRRAPRHGRRLAVALLAGLGWRPRSSG